MCAPMCAAAKQSASGHEWDVPVTQIAAIGNWPIGLLVQSQFGRRLAGHGAANPWIANPWTANPWTANPWTANDPQCQTMAI